MTMNNFTYVFTKKKKTLLSMFGQEFGDTVDRGGDFCYGSNFNYSIKLSRGGPEWNPWLLIGGQD